jgi:cysteine synthase A
VNWRGEDNLAAETARQMADRRHPIPAWIVLGAGTGWTGSLFARHARLHDRDSRLCVADPENSAFLSHPGTVDHMIEVPAAASIATIRKLERWTGRRFGGSTGTTVWGALRLAADMRAHGRHGSIVVIAGDGGDHDDDIDHSDRSVAAQDLDLQPYERTLRYLKATGEWLDPR